jgi:signal transduction histidine kinase
MLAWCGAVAFPFVLYVTLLNLPDEDVGLRLLLPAFVLALPAGLLRRAPLPALALMLAGAFAVTASRHSTAFAYPQVIAVDLAVAFVAANQRRAISIPAAALTLATQLAGVPYYTAGNDSFTMSTVFVILAVATAWTIGDSFHQRAAHARALRAQAAAQAVTDERLRIAREVHDMVAHSIGIIAIQAGAGARVIDTQPGAARDALATIETTSRETLAGLRGMLGGLRQPAGADLTPALAGLERLAAATRAAGVEVEVRWQGERRPVPVDIDLSAYRIVQEAITNVIRHAGTDRCRVTVDYGTDALAIEVVDEGRGAPAELAAGFGIAGMRERVGLLRGQFSAGPGPAGGFRVAATLPVPAR